MPEFTPWPKVARLNRRIVITEKIDGTNAAVGVTEDGEVYAQSRTRLITPEADNFGFARFVSARASDFRDLLGPGVHFGEWWGNGIQRGYGLQDKRFSLFNTERWALYDGDFIEGVAVVPVLYEGPFDADSAGYDGTSEITRALILLREHGSQAAPGFMKPEGIVLFHTAARTMFKVTLENDDQPKGVQA